MAAALEEALAVIEAEGIRPLEVYLETGELPTESSSSNTSAPKEYDSEGQLLPTRKGLFRHRTYMKLYNVVYSLCTQNNASNYTAKLYEAHYEAVCRYVQRCTVPALQARLETGDDQQNSGQYKTAFLRELHRRWEAHKVYTHWMEKIFTYLDRHYTRAFGKPSLHSRGKEAFLMLALQPLVDIVRDALLDQVDEARGHTAAVNRTLLRALIHLFVELGYSDSLGLYLRELESALLPRTRQYYLQKSGEWLAASDFAGYLERAEAALSAETKLGQQCFPEVTTPKLHAVVQIAILTDRMREILAMEKGLAYLFQQERHTDLQRAFRLFGLLDNGFVPLAQALKEYVIECGNAIVDKNAVELAASSKAKSTLAEKQLLASSAISEFMELHEKFLARTASCFHQHFAFQKAVKEAFESFMNRQIGPQTMPVLLAAYCDQVLRGRICLSINTPLEAVLQQLVNLFEFLLDKDLFIDQYRNQLARRLINDTTTSIDAEKLMIARLKLTCGSVYTARMEGMLTDLAASSETVRHFTTWVDKERVHLPLSDFAPRVLTCGHWPAYQTPDLTLPPQMQKCADIFADWYIRIHTDRRRIAWINHLGTASVQGSYDGGKRVYTFLCNTYQAALLLCFNDPRINSGPAGPGLTLDELCAETGIESSLARNLLTCLQVAKILLKNKRSDGSETYTVNENITFKGRLLKVPVPAQEKSSMAQAKDKAQEDRSIAIDAAIVRCMKQRKECKHAELVNEVTIMLQMFRPTPRQIKQKIEDLINREFLQRDPTDATTYRYVA